MFATLLDARKPKACDHMLQEDDVANNFQDVVLCQGCLPADLLHHCLINATSWNRMCQHVRTSSKAQVTWPRSQIGVSIETNLQLPLSSLARLRVLQKVLVNC